MREESSLNDPFIGYRRTDLVQIVRLHEKPARRSSSYKSVFPLP